MFSKMRSSSPGAGRNLDADIAGELLKRADLGNHHGLPQAQRAQQRARAFAHRREAQVQHNIARRQIADEILDGRKADHPRVGLDSHGADHRFHRQFPVRLAYKNHLRRGSDAHESVEHAQRFGDALVRFQEAEDADQRNSFVGPRRRR